MAKRLITLLFCVSLILCVGTSSANAKQYTTSHGTISSTYVQYFKDILSNTGIKDNYVAFRTEDTRYIMLVGELEYDESGAFYAPAGVKIKEYQFSFVNNVMYYDVTDITDGITIASDRKLFYSNMGNFPDLMEKGVKYEILTAVLVATGLLGVVVGRFFRRR